MRPACRGKKVYESLIRDRAATGQGGVAGILEGLKLYFSQAGIKASPLRFIAYGLGAVAGVWLAATVMLGVFGASRGFVDSLMSLFAAAILVAACMWLWVIRKHAKRMKQLEDQLPLALDIVIRAIRAGHPVISAVQLVTEELVDPIGTEFGLIVDETTYGFEFREALRNFARRTGSEDAHFFSVSVGIQSETGGNLAEILANLAAVIRARSTLGKRVRALSSEGRMSAVVLSLLPVMLIGFVGMSQPSFYTSKFADPIFWPIVFLTLGIYMIGQVIMNRIVNFKY